MHSRLPNAPLTEVACELRFDARSELLAKWGPVQEALRAAFPQLQMRPGRPGASPFVQPLQLASADGATSVTFALDSLSLSTRSHSTYEDFKQQFAQVVDLFARQTPLAQINRVSLRYRNRLPPQFPGEPVAGQLHPCLSLRAAGWRGLDTPLIEPAQFVAVAPCHSVKIRIALVPLHVEQPLGAPGEMQLDLDAYQDQPLAADRLWATIDAAHDAIEETFFAVVTPEYLKFLEG